MTVRLRRCLEIARIAKTAGFNMLYIDIEHSRFDGSHRRICIAALDVGIVPVVRVPGTPNLSACSTPALSA